MKNLTIVLFSCFTLLLYAQDSLINSTVEVHLMSGFRFELHHQPSSSTYVVDPFLSNCNTVIFYPTEKEVIGFYHGPLKVETDSLNQTSGFNIHRLCFKGVNLEQLTIESKIWHLPWNYPYWID